jgi:GT2 family glycosyltransferase
MQESSCPLAVVVVSYNTVGLLRQCLRSVELPGAPPLELFVVDNASTDGSADMVAGEFPRAQLIRNDQNVGFSRANNQALRLASAKYLCLLNSDAEVRDGALARMVGYLDAHPDVGVVGPRLLYPDGSPQSSRRRFPTIATALIESTVVQRWLPNAPALRRYYVADVPDDRVQEVDWLVGACIVVRREAIDDVGLLDERFFMYSEELDWCRRIRAAGWRIVYLPGAVAVHHESRSAEQNLARRSILFFDSRCKYFAKHYGRGWGRLLQAYTFLTFAYQMAEEGGKLLVGHKPSLRRQRLSMLREVIGWQARQLVRRLP